MARWKLTLEYDGGPFAGWQRQDNVPSIQASLEQAINKFCGETVTVSGAGRTDAGVHALGQVAHADIEKTVAPDKLRDALNAHLRPAPVAVLRAEPATPEFHARFDATARHYLYRLVNRRSPPTLDRGHVWPVQIALDSDAMHEAASRRWQSPGIRKRLANASPVANQYCPNPIDIGFPCGYVAIWKETTRRRLQRLLDGFHQ